MKNRTAFVTGAAGGIGRATVERLCQQEIKVIAIDSSQANLDSLVVNVHGKISSVLLNISDWENTEKVITSLVAEHGTPDYLVNGAGINPLVDGSDKISQQFYESVMDTNFTGTFLASKLIIALMAKEKCGAVVNIASVAGMRGWGGSSVYSASKGAMIAFTRSLATEYGPAGIRVNAVCPGSIRTPMVLENLLAKNDLEGGFKRITEKHPLGRIGEPREVANAIWFLLSDEASFISGAMLTVDGGLSAS